ncbi:MAG: hypothetical protein ACXVEU_01160 [Nocardioidaceae bacterium]
MSATAFTAGGRTVVLCVADVLAVDVDLAASCATAVADAVGTTSERVLLAATHTHSGPAWSATTAPRWAEAVATAAVTAARAATRTAGAAGLTLHHGLLHGVGGQRCGPQRRTTVPASRPGGPRRRPGHRPGRRAAGRARGAPDRAAGGQPRGLPRPARRGPPGTGRARPLERRGHRRGRRHEHPGQPPSPDAGRGGPARDGGSRPAPRPPGHIARGGRGPGARRGGGPRGAAAGTRSCGHPGGARGRGRRGPGRARRRPHDAALLGYAGGYCGYLPTADAYGRDDYEVLVSRVAPGESERAVSGAAHLHDG